MACKIGNTKVEVQLSQDGPLNNICMWGKLTRNYLNSGSDLNGNDCDNSSSESASYIGSRNSENVVIGTGRTSGGNLCWKKKLVMF